METGGKNYVSVVVCLFRTSQCNENSYSNLALPSAVELCDVSEHETHRIACFLP